MRLSEEKIKQAILHPQLKIRQRAVRYFSVCHSEDESVVSLVIQAVERYGREDAYQLIGGSVDLWHTEETIAWIIEELQDPAAERYENCAALWASIARPLSGPPVAAIRYQGAASGTARFLLIC